MHVHYLKICQNSINFFFPSSNGTVELSPAIAVSHYNYMLSVILNTNFKGHFIFHSPQITNLVQSMSAKISAFLKTSTCFLLN